MIPADLDAEDRARWTQFRASRSDLASPYFDLRYVEAAAETAPHAAVARIRRDGETVGFLPFQRRGALIQPIAAPLTDYHGLLAAPGAGIDLKWVLDKLGARRFRFSGLVGAGRAAAAHGAARRAMVADLSNGFDAYLDSRRAGFVKDKRRRARRLEEDHGPLDFRFEGDGEGVLDFILRLKRDQMRRTGQHDVFGGPWTTAFLQRLAHRSAPDFGLRFASLSAGGRMIAAEVGLRSGDAYHLWFPVYETDFAKYSPGALMTLETLRAAAEEGVRSVDFGPAGEAYKRDFAEPGAQVLEGDVTSGGVVEAVRKVVDFTFQGTPRLRRRIGRTGLRLDRRWDRITGCEPRLEGRVAAASASLARVTRRAPKASIGLGLGLGAGLGVAGLLLD